MTTNQPSTEKHNPDNDFVITREFDAPRELVWKAWTDPRHLAKWWGPRDFTNPVCELDLRRGGAYRITMRAPTGEEYPLHGIFHEVIPPERLSYTMDVSGHPPEWHAAIKSALPAGSTQTVKELYSIVTFESGESGTRLTIRSRFDSPEIRDAMLKMGMNAGWSGSLDRLVDLLPKI